MSIDTLRETFVIAEKLIEHVKERCSDENLALVKQAITFAEEHYALIVHPTGKPYIQYAIEVARMLDDLHLDPIVISTALVYPPPPVEEKTLPDLKKTFKNQKELLALVDDILHLGQLEWSAWSLPPEQHELKGRKEILQKIYRLAIDDLVMNEETLQSEIAFHFQKKEKQVENLIRMFFASANDIHALIIKLVDRLHFIKLLKDVPQSQPVFDNKLLLARITLAIYAPLADRLGIWRLKSELEDMSFRLIQPNTFKAIARKISDKKIEREQHVNEIIQIVRKQLEDFGIQAEISGRAKHIYSVYQKMEAKQLGFEQINDLLGIRIIINQYKDVDKDAGEIKDKDAEKHNEIALCYDVQDILHELWSPVTEPYEGMPGRDWIARPKENQYQSLHTTIIINDKMVEVQIRTHGMHEIAEYGVAASHWRYKESKAYRRSRTVKAQGAKNLLWNEELASLRQSLAYEQETTKPTQKRLLKSRIFAITPDGHVIDLADGATPLDFAYRIHTNLGDTYMGAKVNGRYVRMDYALKNGDIIEISTSRARKGPNPDWLTKNRLDDTRKSQIDTGKSDEDTPKGQDDTGKNDGDTKRRTTPSVDTLAAHTRKFLVPEWLYRSSKETSDNSNEQMYYVFARTRNARSKIRHRLKQLDPHSQP